MTYTILLLISIRALVKKMTLQLSTMSGFSGSLDTTQWKETKYQMY